MIKMMMALSAKPGLTLDDFKRYYETQHLPLVARLFPQIAEHTRNYVTADQFGGPLGFDVLVEVTFADEASASALNAQMEKPEVRDAIAKDEENFLDRSRIRIFPVNQTTTPLGASAST